MRGRGTGTSLGQGCALCRASQHQVSESRTFRTLAHGWASVTVPHSWQWVLATGGGARCGVFDGPEGAAAATVGDDAAVAAACFGVEAHRWPEGVGGVSRDTIGELSDPTHGGSVGSLRLSLIARREFGGGGGGGGGGGERALWHMPEVGGIEGLGSPEEVLPTERT